MLCSAASGVLPSTNALCRLASICPTANIGGHPRTPVLLQVGRSSRYGPTRGAPAQPSLRSWVVGSSRRQSLLGAEEPRLGTARHGTAPPAPFSETRSDGAAGGEKRHHRSGARSAPRPGCLRPYAAQGSSRRRTTQLRAFARASGAAPRRARGADNRAGTCEPRAYWAAATPRCRRGPIGVRKALLQRYVTARRTGGPRSQGSAWGASVSAPPHGPVLSAGIRLGAERPGLGGCSCSMGAGPRSGSGPYVGAHLPLG